MTKPFIIGIAGGTASGKTTVAQKIASTFPEGIAALMDLDSYYKDLSHLEIEDRKKQNFDHPDAFDFDLLIEHLKELRQGHKIEKPIYSFKEHTRLEKKEIIHPAQVIILEGILVLYPESIKELIDFAIYVDTDDDIRLSRRLERDVKERGRTLEGVLNQYFETVRPMHKAFIDPSKRNADIIIPNGGSNQAAVDMVVAGIKGKLTQMYFG